MADGQDLQVINSEPLPPAPELSVVNSTPLEDAGTPTTPLAQKTIPAQPAPSLQRQEFLRKTGGGGTTEEAVAEANKVPEAITEGTAWMAGDSMLDALGRMFKIAKNVPELFKLIEDYPTASKILMESGKGATIGGAAGAGKAAAEGKDIGEGAVTGAKTGALTGGLAAGFEGIAGSEMAQKLINKSMGVTARDVLHGNPAKAILDEGIINPRTGSLAKYLDATKAGKPLDEAIQAAGGRAEAVSEKMNELKPQLDAILAKSPAKIDVNDTILKPIRQASVDMANNAMVQPEVAAAAEKVLDAWSDRIKSLIGTKPISVVRAAELKTDLGKTMSFTKNAAVDDVIAEVANEIYANLKNGIHTAVPEAGPLDERLSNLASAWNKIGPTKAGSLPAQELAGGGKGVEAGNFWDVPQRILAEIGRITPAVHAAAGSAVTRGLAGTAATNYEVDQLPDVEEGHVRFTASDGSVHDVPADQLEAAKKIDPKLKVESATPKFLTK